MTKHITKSPAKQSLDGITLENMLVDLSSYIGWKTMAEKVSINCFKNNPSVKSSLAFLRKTPWARSKVEVMYRFNLNKIQKAKAESIPVLSPGDSIFPLDHFDQKG